MHDITASVNIFENCIKLTNLCWKMNYLKLLTETLIFTSPKPVTASSGISIQSTSISIPYINREKFDALIFKIVQNQGRNHENKK